jgi:sugar phosphate isomerase/epimerase
MNLETIKIGVVASALGEDPREAPRRARTLGFDGLQFDAYSSSFNLPELSGSGRREFLRFISSQDRQLVGLRFDVGPNGFGPGADVDRILDRLDKIMQSAVELSAPLVCVDVGPLPAPQRQSKPKPHITQDMAGFLLLPSAPKVEEAAPPPPLTPAELAMISHTDSALAELGQRADRYSAILAFRSDLTSFAAIERALKTVHCPWFGLDLDPAAVLRDEWNMDEVFSRLGQWIRHVRGRDATAGADRRAKPAVIGAGSTDWPALLADLDASGYHGWLTVDPIELTDRVGAAEVGRKRLQQR